MCYSSILKEMEMATAITEMKKAKTGFNDEFENYLKKQCIKTT